MVVSKKPVKRLNAKLKVEGILKRNADKILTLDEIRSKIPKTVTDNRIITILNNLEEANKIYMTPSGIMWIENKSEKLKSVSRRGRRL